MGIKRLVYLLNVFIIFTLSVVFYFIYQAWQKEIANVVINDIKKDLLESSYLASKALNSSHNIYFLRPILDRKVAMNSVIKGFVVADKKKLFVSGDVNLDIPSSANFDILHISLDELFNSEAFGAQINFYKNGEKRNFMLYMFLEKEKLNKIFKELKTNYFLIYLAIVGVIFFILNYFVQYYLYMPLIKLKKFANLQKEPKKLPIKEFEEIKTTLSASFKNLNKTIKRLHHIMVTDSLTNLGNKKSLNKKVENLIKNNKKFAMVFVDLDNFKEINDFFGHNVGDEIIIKISKLLNSFLKKDEIVTRIGGDEFVLILEPNNLEERLKDLILLLDKKFQLKEHFVATTASAGVAIYPRNGKNFDELLKNADVALNEAKKSGRNRFVVFNEDVKKAVDERFLIKNRLKEAIEKEQFELYLQPKVDKNLNVIGAEALIRWNYENKIIPPNLFIPIAEESGLIYDIGNWVIKTSALMVKKWESDERLKHLSIAFNVSVVQMRHDSFLDDIKKIINEIKPDVSKLQIEITESVFIENKKRALFLLDELRKMGFKINLDDFGTGYSSLSILREFQIDILKVDKSFVDKILDNEGLIYVKTIINMAKTLKLKTVAEGVESKEQFEILKKLDVDYFQGYLFAKPLRVNEFLTSIDSISQNIHE